MSARAWIALLALAAWPATAAEVEVSTFDQLLAALEAAEANGEDDVIQIQAGTYLYSDKLEFESDEDHSLTIQGQGEVILNGSGWRPLYIWTHGQGAHVTIRGVALIGGHLVEDYGAGLFVRTQFGDITLEGVELSQNTSTSVFFSSEAAGGFLRTESSATIRLDGNRILNNYAKGTAGGLMIKGGAASTILLRNNVFYANEANSQGAGADISLVSGTLVMVNNTFVGNDNSSYNGYGGGGVRISAWNDDASVQLHNNIFWDNNAECGLGHDVYLADDGDGNGVGAAVELGHNDLHDVHAESGSNLVEADSMDVDPSLSSGLHLLDGSPCIDAGNAAAPELPDVDFDGDDRILGAAPDLGADEYVAGQGDDDDFADDDDDDTWTDDDDDDTSNGGFLGDDDDAGCACTHGAAGRLSGVSMPSLILIGTVLSRRRGLSRR